jgi:hypothetical protein
VQSSNGLFRYYQKEILIKRKIHAPIGASGGAVDPTTHRKWVWAFIDAIAEPPIPQHAHARVYPHGREDHPQAIRESNEQAHLQQGLAHLTPVVREGKEV